MTRTKKLTATLPCASWRGLAARVSRGPNAGLLKRSAIYCFILLAMATIIAAAKLANAQRAIPKENPAFPVLIIGKSYTTSGFYINNGTLIYLVTATHMLFDPATNMLRNTKVQLLSYPPKASDPGRYLVEVDLSALQGAGKIKTSPNEDVSVVNIATVLKPPSTTVGGQGKYQWLPGVTVKESSTGGIVIAPIAQTRTIDQVLVGNEAVVFGYPTSIGLPELPQLVPLRPLLRKGIVAGKGINDQSIVLALQLHFVRTSESIASMIQEVRYGWRIG
jgi:hypothetical protein